ncbi:MAG: hypothetical protein HQL77_09310 [Magnetococcales bacterium]|nr:hypothetical protein [Magnetococcales bacterium]
MRIQSWIVPLGIAGMLVFLGARDFFPNHQGALGRHFAVSLPQLLDGYLWMRVNGLGTVPWFTPSFCGGLPVLADPANLFYSIPQWLTLLWDPLKSAFVTFGLFSMVGLIGFYRLLHDRFHISSATSWMGGVLFMGNQYYVNQMLLGQLACHVFMLTPWIAWLLTCPSQGGTPLIKEHMVSSVSAAFLLAYGVWSGAMFLMVPIGLALLLVGLTWSLHRPDTNRYFLRRFMVSVFLAAGLSAAKWWPGVQWLANLDAAPIPLAFIKGMDDAFLLLLYSLFVWQPGRDTVLARSFDPQYPLETTFDYGFGVTFIPLLLLIVAAIAWMANRFATVHRPPLARLQQIRLTAMIVIAVIPLALSSYSPLWNAWQRTAPIWNEGMPLIHGWSSWVVAILVWSCLAYERLPWSVSQRREQALAAMLMVVLVQVFTDRSSLQAESYDPKPIVSAYHEVQATGRLPEISQIGAAVDDQTKNVTLPLSRNNAVVMGISFLFCNEPIFGSLLQRFPYQPLVLGPVTTRTEAGFNMKNPACYLAPVENHCRVGGHFQFAQQQALDQLVHYRPFAFAKPQGQETMEWVSLLSVIVLVLALLWVTMDRMKGTKLVL